MHYLELLMSHPLSREERAHLYLSEKEIDSIMISEIIPNVM